MQHGFARIGVGIPRVTVADCEKNLTEIKALVTEADAAAVDVLVFPELALTGATCGALFYQSALLEAAERSLADLIAHTAGLRPLVAVGLPILVGAELRNCAAILSNGTLLGIVPKSSMSTYNDTHETHWFCTTYGQEDSITVANTTTPYGAHLSFRCESLPALTVNIAVGEDLFAANATVQLHLSASAERIGRAEARRNALIYQSASSMAAYAQAGTSTGESTTDAAYSGCGLIAENGRILLETERFQQNSHLSYYDVDIDLLQKDRRPCISLMTSAYIANPPIPFRLPPTTRPLARRVDPIPFLPPGPVDEHCREAFAIQTAALIQRLEASKSKTAVLGISGGLDSTLALLVTANAYDVMGRDRADILAVTMPGFGTTERTRANANSLMTHLGVTRREIPIEAACLQHFSDIGHDPAKHDVTYENAQARERTQILMSLANQTEGLVIGSGNLSELALGFTTYGGDHLSMYAINIGIPKTLVRKMVEWLAASDRYTPALRDTMRDILETPVSPELLPADGTDVSRQETESLIGPYALHDFFLYYVVRYGFSPAKIVSLAETAFADVYNRETIVIWLEVFYRRFFAGQFKRSCSPDGPRVGPISLSPRDGWHMPSDAACTAWLRELKRLKDGIL